MFDLSKLTKADVNNIEYTLCERLRTVYGLLSTGVGSVVRELIIHPFAILSAYLNKEVAQIKASFDFRKDTTGMLDSFAKNFGLVRRPGTKASGYVAVVVDSTDSIYVAYGTSVTINGVPFQVTRLCYSHVGSTGLSDRSDIMTREMIKHPNGYLFTLPVESVGVVSVSLPPNTPATIVGIRSVECFAITPIYSVSEPETNDALLDRIRSVGVARNLSTKQSIKYSIEDKYNLQPGSVSVFSSNDVEQPRAYFGLIDGNISGRTDIYVRGSVIPLEGSVVLNAAVDGNDLIIDLDSIVCSGLVGITRIAHTLNGMNLIIKSVAYTTPNRVNPSISKPEHAVRSDYMSMQVRVGKTDSDITTAPVVCYYQYFANITDIQAFAVSDDIAPLSSDLLVKSMVPCRIGVDIILTDVASTLEKKAIQSLISGLITSMPKFDMDAICKQIHLQYPHISIRNPIRLSAEVRDIVDLYEYSSSTGDLNIPAKIGSKGLYKSMLFYYSHPSDVTIG